MTTSSRHEDHGDRLRVENARNAKAHDAVDAIFYLIDHTTTLEPWRHDTLDRLDDRGWAVLAQLIGRSPDRLSSPETRAKVRKLYRHKLEQRRRLAAMTLDEVFDFDDETGL